MADKDFSFGFEYKNKRYRDAQKGLRALSEQLHRAPEIAVPILRTNLKDYLDAVVTALAQKHGKA